VVFLQDGRRQPGSEEIFLWEFLRDRDRLVIPVLTKADKVKQGERHRQLQLFAGALKANSLDPGDAIWFSATTREGRDRLWDRLQACLEEVKASAGAAIP
jgi:GTP-binding protein